MRPLLIVGHQRPVTHVRFDSTGTFVYSSGKDGVLAVWDATDGRAIGTYEFQLEGTTMKCCWEFETTLDGARILAASAEGAFVFNAETGDQISHSKLNDAGCRAAAWCSRPDQQTKFVVARDALGARVERALIIYERTFTDAEGPGVAGRKDEYTPILTVSGEDFPHGCVGVAFGPFDKTVLSRHDTGEICVWNAEDGKLIRKVKAHDGSVTGWDLARERYIMLTSSKDQKAKLWSLPDLELISEYVTDRPLNSCSLTPLFDASNPNFPLRRILVGGGQESSKVTTTRAAEGKAEALLLDLITGELVGSIGGHFSPINSLALHPSGKGFVTGAEEGIIKIFTFDP